MALYESKKDDQDFIQANFYASEVEKIRQFLAYEKLLKERCAEFDFPYEPPSKNTWDRARKQKMHCRWAYNSKPKDS